MDNFILKELNSRCSNDPKSLAVKFNLLADTIIEIASEHQKRVVAVMTEFDLHDATHLTKVLDNISDLIGDKRVKKLSHVELFLLIAAAYLHDIGMAPAEWEIKLMTMTEGYSDFILNNESICNDGKVPFTSSQAKKFIQSNKAKIYRTYSGEVENWTFSENNEDALIEALVNLLIDYQNFRNGVFEDISKCKNREEFQKLNNSIRVDFIRTRHHICSARYIKNALPLFMGGLKEGWVKGLVNDLAEVCQAHGENINCIERFNTECKYCSSEGVNLQFIAMMLRMGDICHYSADRAPLILRNAKLFASDYSYREWVVKDAAVSYDIKDGKVGYYAYCDVPEKYYKLQEYLDWIDLEINNFSNLQRNWSSKYQLSIKDVDRSGINYDKTIFKPVRGKQFTLQQNKIIELLMGVGLYKNPFACLRELYQNSMDACKCQLCMASSHSQKFQGHIEFGLQKENTGTYLYCMDNGTGMNEDIIEKYLLKIGNSYYKSSDFYRQQALWRSDFVPTSQFGIGILSCFMIASKIDVVTKIESSTDCIACCIDGPQEYFYYRMPKQAEKEKISVSGTIVRLLLKEDIAKEINDNPLDKLGLVLQYHRDNMFSNEFEEYNELFDIWSEHIYNKVNNFVNKMPDNIELVCRISDGTYLPILNKPLALRVGDWGITDEDRKFINTIISRRMFFENKLTIADIQDYLKEYKLKVKVDGIEYESIISMPLPGMPATNDDRALFNMLKVSGSVISVDGVAIESKQSRMDNLYFELLTRYGRLNYTGKNKPLLSVDRLEIINFNDGDGEVYRKIAIEAIKEIITIAKVHIENYSLSQNVPVVNLIWKYVFDRIGHADVLFVNYLAKSKLGAFKWPALSSILNNVVTISKFMEMNDIQINNYDYTHFDLLTQKLVFAKLFAANCINITSESNVRIHCKKTITFPENNNRFNYEMFLVPVSDSNECFREYDIISNLYPLVPERLVTSLSKHRGVDNKINDSKAISVPKFGNSYVAFFDQDARLIHQRLGLYRIDSGIGTKLDSCIYSFDNKVSNFQFFDFGYNGFSEKRGLMMLAFVAPRELTEKDKIKIEEYKESDPDYYRGVIEGWSILITAMKIDNLVILPGKRSRDEMLKNLSSDFRKEYKDFEFKFLDGNIVDLRD